MPAQQATAAQGGKACSNCARIKCKCIPLANSEICERRSFSCTFTPLPAGFCSATLPNTSFAYAVFLLWRAYIARCHRLKKEYVPSAASKGCCPKYHAASRSARLEEELDDLVTFI